MAKKTERLKAINPGAIETSRIELLRAEKTISAMMKTSPIDHFPNHSNRLMAVREISPAR